MHKRKLLLLIGPLALASCSFYSSYASNGTTGSTGTGGGNTTTKTTATDGPGTSQPFSDSSSSTSQDDGGISYEDFWNVATATNIELRFTNASLYALSDYGANYDQKYADVYFPASIKIQVGSAEISYAEVGVRMKGNNSRTTICSTDGTISDVCHFKVSFKCTFDDSLYDLSQFSSFKHDWTNDAAGRKTRKARRFAGMEKLDLKFLPRNNNLTYSQEIYCFHVFEQMGIQSPLAKRSSLTFADAKGSKTSAYECVEAMDDSFVSHHFPTDAGGDLYKCSTYTDSNNSYIKADLAISGAVSSSFDSSTGYANGTRIANGKIGVEDNYSLYHPNYQLKTNDDGEKSDFSKMANLINAVYSVRYKKAPYSLLDGVLDVNEFLTFEGVSYALGNFDDQRNNYNNYFIYFRPSDGKAVYIPYDWDWSLGACMMIDVTSWQPYHTKTSHDSSSTNSLYWCTILTSSSLSYSQTSLRSTYASTVKSLVSKGFLTYATYTNYIGTVSGAGTEEFSDVKSYMSSKTSVISSASW
jgi:spore coat protein CotH